jgi:hypothetical protein
MIRRVNPNAVSRACSAQDDREGISPGDPAKCATGPDLRSGEASGGRDCSIPIDDVVFIDA